MASLLLRHVAKRYGETAVIHGDRPRGRATASSSSSSDPRAAASRRSLRVIAGLETASEGDLLIDGKRVNDVSAAQRGLAMVFQSYALYPHMTVYQNLAFGLENLRTPRPEIDDKVRSAAKMLRLDALLERRPRAAVRRPAPTRRDRARHRPQPDDLPVRRAAFEPRRRVARADARGDHRSARSPARRR